MRFCLYLQISKMRKGHRKLKRYDLIQIVFLHLTVQHFKLQNFATTICKSSNDFFVCFYLSHLKMLSVSLMTCLSLSLCVRSTKLYRLLKPCHCQLS